MRIFDATNVEIHEALSNDERTAGASIEVLNEQGIVTLTGEVESQEIALAAEDIVSRQDGVFDVMNALRIRKRERSKHAKYE
jgi:osmotically-inducible protein OsmY